MDQTTYWMLGVIAVGLVFYCFSVYFANQAEQIFLKE